MSKAHAHFPGRTSNARIDIICNNNHSPNLITKGRAGEKNHLNSIPEEGNTVCNASFKQVNEVIQIASKKL